MALTDFQKGLLQKFVDKHFKEAEKDTQTFDLEANIDDKLTYSENKNSISQKLKELGIITMEKEYAKIPKKAIKEEVERLEMEQIHLFEEKSQELQKSAIESILRSPPNLKKFFRIPRKMINSFLDDKQTAISGMILQGGTGIGKTYQCEEIFNEHGWKLDIDYAILTGYVSPMELYIFLHKNRDMKAILFDDIAKMFDNELSRGLLLAALWNTSGKRVVSYQSSSDKLVDEDGKPIPRSTPITSKILWSLNDLPAELDNIKSRVYYYPMEFNYKKRVLITYEICKAQKIPMEIADFIRDNTNEAYNIDFRLPLKLYGFYKTNKNDWQELAKAILKPDEDLLVIKEAIAHFPSVNEAIQEYVNKTGHSRATFFRRKKLLVQNIFFQDEYREEKSQSIKDTHKREQEGMVNEAKEVLK